MPSEGNNKEAGSSPEWSKTSCSQSELDDKNITLGVLLVHGIGTQRRGDTLLQAGDALHQWLRRWLKVDVQVVDSDIAPSTFDSSTPAQVHMVFPAGTERGSTSWILAECHWAEAFRALPYHEFVGWAWRIVPWAVLLHLLPRFRQVWQLFDALRKTRKSKQASPETIRLFKRYVGRYPEIVDGLLSAEDLSRIRNRTFGSIVAASFSAAILAVVGLGALIVLSLLRLMSFLLPFEAVRQLALDMQFRLSGTIGDSSVYLSSPLIASAILTKLHRDLNWLTARCDRIVILAHSQGAAVAYDAIHRWVKTGHREPRLTHLITYGSGLRKLFDLRAAQQESTRWSFYGYLVFGFSIAFFAFAVAILITLGEFLKDPSLRAAFEVTGIAFGALIIWVLILGVLVATSESADTDPELLDPKFDGPEWDNLYASHDPVPNGPITVTGIWEQMPSAPALEFLSGWTPARDGFYARQREVTNWRSLLRDHTSYWECIDDFVARVGNRLVELSGGEQIRIHRAWIEVAAERRRWRVGNKTCFRWVTAIMGLMAIFTSRVNVVHADADYQIFDGLTVQFFGLATWTVPLVFLPDWLFRILLMLGALAIPLVVAEKGFKCWEQYELRQFFHRVCISVYFR